jgi:hypothetical protein
VRRENIAPISDESGNIVPDCDKAVRQRGVLNKSPCASNAQREQTICRAHSREPFAAQVNIANSARVSGIENLDTFWEKLGTYSFSKLVVSHASNPSQGFFHKHAPQISILLFDNYKHNHNNKNNPGAQAIAMRSLRTQNPRQTKQSHN